MLNILFDEIKRVDPKLTLSILEVGARPLSSTPERFYHLLKLLPGTQIYGIEVDEILCSNLNKVAPKGLQYFPEPLGNGVNNTRIYHRQMKIRFTKIHKLLIIK